TDPTMLYPLSLHDALPLSAVAERGREVVDAVGGEVVAAVAREPAGQREARVVPQHAAEFDLLVRDGPGRVVGDLGQRREQAGGQDRKSTRLNSSHVKRSYA